MTRAPVSLSGMGRKIRLLYLVLPACGLAMALLSAGSYWFIFYPHGIPVLFVTTALEPFIKGGSALMDALLVFTAVASWLAAAHIIVWLAGHLQRRAGICGPAPEDAIDLGQYVLTGIAVMIALFLTRALLNMPMPPGGDLLAVLVLVVILSMLIPPPVIIAYRVAWDEYRRIRECRR